MLAYTYILTEGYPCLLQGLQHRQILLRSKSEIDKLLFVHEHIANGNTLQSFKDFDVFAYERLGSPHPL
jgi:hypothetical protein